MQNTRVLILFRVSARRHHNSIKMKNAIFKKGLNKKFLRPTIAIAGGSHIFAIKNVAK